MLDAVLTKESRRIERKTREAVPNRKQPGATDGYAQAGEESDTPDKTTTKLKKELSPIFRGNHLQRVTFGEAGVGR